MKRPALIGALAIMFAASLWALDGAVLRPSLYSLDPTIVVLLEHLIAFCFMLPFFIYESKELKKLTKKDWGAFFWIAVFGGTIGTLAITKAYFSVFLDGVSSISVVVLLQKTQPVFAILLAMIILKEHPKRGFFFWAATALLGSYLVAFGIGIPDFSADIQVLYVPMFALIAAFAFGSSTVFGRHVVQKVNFRMATYIRFGLTSLIMILIVLSFNRGAGFEAVTMKNLITLLIIAFSTGGVAIFIYYFGLKRVQASKATIYELMYPIVAIFLDYFVHGHLMAWDQFLGAALLITAIINVTSS
ncbi:MAG: DMT family transporter [Nanoarchaeota archaeon]|nr:DMT family transporter [Nanoarchaeota archaeon]